MQPIVELNERIWQNLRTELSGVGPQEAEWRPLPQANSISILVRHLRIEAEWQLASLEHGEESPTETTPILLQFVDSVPLDFEQNRRKLDELCTKFIEVLREKTLDDIEKGTVLVYKGYPADHLTLHFLGFHHPTHLAMHWGQIRTIRTLYLKTRGEPVPPRFHPDNLSYPH